MRLRDDALGTADALDRWLSRQRATVLLVDAGGVLFNNVIEDSTFIGDLAAYFDVSRHEMLTAYAAADRAFETNARDVHEVIGEAVRALAGRAPGPGDFAQIDGLYAAAVVANAPLFDVLRSARRRGLTLVLANNEAERWDRIKQGRFGHLDLFDHCASSWKIGACKPTAEYFDRLEDLLRRPRAAWHLLDDNPAVVAQARAFGVPATVLTFAPAGEPSQMRGAQT